MGGKAKQAQRTKNNARPASSGRSAELLSNPTRDSAIFGFGNGKTLPPLFSTLSAVNYEHCLNSEFALCFKKFNKKDPITRAKALQEFLELTKNSNVDDVVTALPAWAHYYPMFTIDTDRKVRECAQACHAAVVKVSGRRIAPHLKKLLPAWLLAQHDDHGPAQHHAHSSITSTFPEGKLGDAMTFCKVEIISLLVDNLTGNAEAMLTKKIENKEERDVQVSQVVASSLRALEFFVAQLPSSEDDWLWEAVTPLLRAASFWKFIQNPNEHNFVKAAWYGCVGRVCAREGPRVAQEMGARAAQALLLPAAAALAAPRWAALLAFATALPEWWSWFDKQEILGKRIVEVVENGGWGDAGLLSRLVLPLLARMPPHMLSERLFRDLLGAMFKGLERKNILNAKSERQAWITNLADCLRFLSAQRSTVAFLEIATNAHRTWLERILAIHESTIRKNLIRHSAANMATLFKFWLKSSNDGIEYDQLIRNCWQNIGSTISSEIDKLSSNSDEIYTVMENHILLLQSLKLALTQEAKKQLSIKFSDEPERKCEKVSIPKIECDAIVSERYMHNLTETAYTVCSLYLQFAYDKKVAEIVVTNLITLLTEFDSQRLYVTMANHLNADSVYGLYDRVLRAWLLDGTMRCRPLVEVVFFMLRHLGQQEQDALFQSFEQFPEAVVEWCLALSTSHPWRGEGGAGRWVRGAAARRALGAACRRAAREGDGAAAALLLRCLAVDGRGEWLTSEETVGDVVSELCEALRQVPAARLERCARTAAQCLAALGAPACPRAPHALAAALVALQLDVPRGDERLSLETWLEVSSSWQDAIASSSDEARRSLENHVISLVHERLFENERELDMRRMESMAALLPWVAAPSDYAPAPADCTPLADFARRLLHFPSADTLDGLEYRALRCDCVYAHLNCPFDDENTMIKRIVDESAESAHSELSEEELMQNARKCLFRAFYLRATLFRSSRSEDDDADDVTWCNSILKDAYFQEEFVQLLRSYIIFDRLHERYAFWLHYENIGLTEKRLEALIGEVIEESSTETRQGIRQLLAARSDAVGYYWAFAKTFYDLQIDTKARDTQNDKNLSDEDKTDSSIYYDDDSKTLDYEDAEAEPSGTPEPQANQEESDVAVSIEDDGASEESEREAVKWEELCSGSGLFHAAQAQLKYGVGQGLALQVRYQLALRSVSAAHEREPGVVPERWLAERGAACDPDAFLDLYYRHNHTMLYDRELRSAPWAQVVSNGSVLDFLTELVAAKGWELPARHWDFITISLCSIINSIVISVNDWGCTKVALLSRAALALFARVRPFACGVRAESERRQPAEHLLALQREWDDVFAPDINAHLLRLFLALVENEESNLSTSHIATLNALSSAMSHLQWDKIPQVFRAEALSLDKLAKAAAATLQAARHPGVKLLAFKALSALGEPLVLADAELLSQWSSRQGEGREDAEGEGEEPATGPPALSLQVFQAPLKQLHEVVEAALSRITVCEETCELVPLSLEHNMAVGYLMLTTALHEQCELARGDLVHHYIEHFRNLKYGEHLMPISLRLLPAAIMAYALDDTASTPLPKQYLRYFVDTVDIAVEEACVAESARRLACRGLVHALAGAGAAGARGWWGALGAREARAARRVVAAYVAPLLRRRHFAELRRKAHLLTEAEVTIVRSTGEVRCAIQVDGQTVELTVAFSEAHPLVPPKALAPSYAALQDTQWLSVYLAYQNGRLVNALQMWTSAVRARLENAAQCYICYCRLQPGTGKLPNVLCYQCKNKFHTRCLRKWFSTSGKAICPLCRSKF